MPFNIPIALTWLRIVLIPVFVAVYYLPDTWLMPVAKNWTAMSIFAGAAITDWLDGFLARRMNLNSALGKMLDPIADKLLVASCLLMLAADESIKGWSLFAAIIILCREILVSGLREYLAGLRVRVPVTRLAKWKTTVQLVAIGFLLGGEAGDRDFMAFTGSSVPIV
ncbi:MAG: CDP-diacylglycerol--glycerol-3-phosphate 3-phosphatidyltransferase, partial [Casimicrobiaceae bacterium]